MCFSNGTKLKIYWANDRHQGFIIAVCANRKFIHLLIDCSHRPASTALPTKQKKLFKRQVLSDLSFLRDFSRCSTCSCCIMIRYPLVHEIRWSARWERKYLFVRGQKIMRSKFLKWTIKNNINCLSTFCFAISHGDFLLANHDLIFKFYDLMSFFISKQHMCCSLIITKVFCRFGILWLRSSNFCYTKWLAPQTDYSGAQKLRSSVPEFDSSVSREQCFSTCSSTRNNYIIIKLAEKKTTCAAQHETGRKHVYCARRWNKRNLSFWPIETGFR